jgi:putative ABC transport system permease protein
MIRHFFKLVWNRRRANTLILIELLVSFLALCGLLVAIYNDFDNYRQPLGFDYENVWNLDMSYLSYSMADDETKHQLKQTASDIYLAMSGMDEIAVNAALNINIPFSFSRMCDRCYIDGIRHIVEITETSPEIAEVLDFKLIAGRWLEADDAVLNWIPVVITQNLALALYGDENPLGKEIVYFGENGIPDQRGENDPIRRVVGVISDYRRTGELNKAIFAEFRTTPVYSEDLADNPPSNFVFKVNAGVTASFEKKLLHTVQAVAPDWTFNTQRLDDVRADRLESRMVQLLVFVVIAWFLITMVGMGLVGVLWQNVTQRTHEMGLRRALGATATEVRWQILGELLALTTLAVIIGTVIFLQFPILKIFPSIEWYVYLIGLALALFVIYPFVILCGLYPSWLATRIHPVQALQYE